MFLPSSPGTLARSSGKHLHGEAAATFCVLVRHTWQVDGLTVTVLQRHAQLLALLLTGISAVASRPFRITQRTSMPCMSRTKICFTLSARAGARQDSL